MVFLWFSYGFPIKLPFSYGFPMVFLWFPTALGWEGFSPPPSGIRQAIMHPYLDKLHCPEAMDLNSNVTLLLADRWHVGDVDDGAISI